MRIVGRIHPRESRCAAVFLLSRIIFFGGMRSLADLLNSTVIELCKRAKIQDSLSFSTARERERGEERERKGDERETESIFHSKML